jgi:glycosyltransferase involved in cell wall biosynthesis
MPSLYSKADVMLLSLKGGSLVSETVPAKLQTYMSSGKAILAMIDGDANEIIQEAKCGFVCKAGDFKLLALNANLICNLKINEIEELEVNSKKYYEKYFSREKSVIKMQKILSLKQPH